MAFSGDEHYVARLCQGDGAKNCFCSIHHDFEPILSHSLCDLRDDALRIFFPRIVGSYNRIIGVLAGYSAHFRTLLAVPIAATTKHNNDPTRGKFA